MGLDSGLIDSNKNELMYWGKANAIHRWFVLNVQGGEDDCKMYKVTYEQIEDLLKVIKKVLDSEELAEECLPSCEGFFFGDTEYNEWYFQYLKKTYDTLTEKLKGYSKKNKFNYWSSW